MTDTRRDADLPALLLDRPMSRLQWVAVWICVLVNVIDGFEILSAGYTAPAIAREFGLAPATLGYFLSAGPTGMILGALALAPLADVIGRRRLVIACLIGAASGMIVAAGARGFAPLLIARFVTGVGVGAMMVAVNTVTAEASNRRRHDLALVMQATGFPLGGALCGWLASSLAPGDWRWIYGGGAGAALLMLPLIVLFLPESLAFLIARRPADALARVQRLAQRFALPVPSAMPAVVAVDRTTIRRRACLTTPASVAICTGFFLMMLSFYFLTSWTPKLLADAGAGHVALSGAALMSAGGVAGDLAVGALALRWRADRIGGTFAISCFASAVALAWSASGGGPIWVAAFVLGFFLYGTMACHYASVPAVYPAAVRASGTGLAVGIGRLGAAVGPLLGGALLAGGAGAAVATIAMTLPLLACAWLFGRMAHTR